MADKSTIEAAQEEVNLGLSALCNSKLNPKPARGFLKATAILSKPV